MGDTLKALAVTHRGLSARDDGAVRASFDAAVGTWWVWGALVTIALMMLTVAIAPVYIAPLFNTYTPLKPSPIRDEILRLAHANGISAQEVYQVDASRQTTRGSAPTSAVSSAPSGSPSTTTCSTARRRPRSRPCSGHEMGHYVLNHGYKMLLALGARHRAAASRSSRGCSIGWPPATWPDGASWRVDGSRRAAADRPAALVLHLPADTRHQHDRPHERVRGRHLRSQRRTTARRLRGGSAAVERLPQDGSRVRSRRWSSTTIPSGRTRIFTAMQWKAFAKP